MDKEEAIKILKNFHDKSALFSVRTALETLHPELKESEDERIRKELIEHVKDQQSSFISAPDCRDKYEEEENNKYNSWLFWLEKQGTYTKKDVDDAFVEGMALAKNELEKQGGITKLSEEEQNTFAKVVQTSCAMSFIDYLDAHKYDRRICISNGEREDIEDAFHNAMWDRLHRYYCKFIKGEQISTEWSEEDENKIDTIISVYRPSPKLVKWLKSIKERYTWKPSDEQITVLELASKYERVFTPKQIDILIGLKEQLKKLREE